MGKHLDYYTRERDQYQDAEQIQVSESRAQEIVPKIFARFRVPAVRLVINRRARRWSWYRIGSGLMSPRKIRGPFLKSQRLEMAPNMMDWLTLAHEIAHALHCYDYHCRWHRDPTIPKERWHGPEHSLWLRKIMKYLRQIQVLPSVDIEASTG